VQDTLWLQKEQKVILVAIYDVCEADALSETEHTRHQQNAGNHTQNGQAYSDPRLRPEQ
jgi:hypothetical protein